MQKPKHASPLLTLTLRRFAAVLLFQSFPNAVAFLANLVPVTAVPESVNYWGFVLGIAGGAENFGGITV